jgi:hypothetical protein
MGEQRPLGAPRRRKPDSRDDCRFAPVNEPANRPRKLGELDTIAN